MSKKRECLSIIAIIIGAILASFSVACVLLPNDVIDYGTAGIGIIINKVTGFSLSLSVFFVVLPFLILSIFYLGARFALKATIGSVVYMIGLELFENMPVELVTEHFIAVIFGGAMLGAGLSLILKNGGCIDGSEILANILVEWLEKTFNKKVSMTGILLTFNLFVYAAVFILIDSDSALLSLLVYVVATSVVDHFTDRFEAIKKVTIITKNEEEVVDWIRNKLRKTCTIINSEGAVAGENKTVICYVTYFELSVLKEKIKEIERSAFITVSTIDEIL